MKLHRLLVLVPLLCPRPALAQRETFENFNAWFTWSDELELTPHWAIDSDISMRRSGPVDEWQTFLWRFSLRRTISPNVRVAFGYGGAQSHPYGELPIAFVSPEHRIFEHLQLNTNINRVQLTNRYRFEQRWQGRVASVNGDTSVQNWVRSNRVRYLARATVPLQGKTLDPKEWFLNLSNEVFLNFGANVQQNVFDQNRTMATVGRRLTRNVRLELGYLEQLIEKSSGRQLERNHTIVTQLTTAVKI